MSRASQRSRTTDGRDALARAVELAWPEAELLRSKRGHMTLHRVSPAGFPSVIARVWRRRGARDRLKRAAGAEDGRREWRAMRALAEAGVDVAEPLLLTTLTLPGEGRRRALLVEDLGECERAGDRLKQALAENDLQTAEWIETAVIESTARMLGAGFTDEDHTLMNFGVAPSDRIVRLDLEFARRRFAAPYRGGKVGRMLGRLIASHAYATQETAPGRTEAFAERLAGAAGARPAARRRARVEAERLLESQRRKRGVETKLALRW